MPPAPHLIKHKLDWSGKAKDATGELREPHMQTYLRLAACNSVEVAFSLHIKVARLAVYRNPKVKLYTSC